MAYSSSSSKKQQQHLVLLMLLIIWSCSSSMVFVPYAEANISCAQVTIYIAKCMPYVQRRSVRMDPGCCTGYSNMLMVAKATPDRQNVCNCLKGVAASVGNVDWDRVALIPPTCRVYGPYRLRPSTDCSMMK